MPTGIDPAAALPRMYWKRRGSFRPGMAGENWLNLSQFRAVYHRVSALPSVHFWAASSIAVSTSPIRT